MEKSEKPMGEDCTYILDLYSRRKYTGNISRLKERILELDFDQGILESMAEGCEIGSDGKLEIYVESRSHDQIDPEEFIETIKKLEETIGNFSDDSTLKWEIEFPFSSKTWAKHLYEWELAFDEEDTYLEDGNERWEDPEWSENY